MGGFMTENTKFGVIVSERVAEVHEHDIPSIRSTEVRIENKSCNICTTDYQQWMGLRPHQPTPMAFGHENSGIVVEVGNEVKNVKVGDHAVFNTYHPCMECEDCRKGRNSILCNFRKNTSDREADAHGYFGNYGCSTYQIGKSKHIYKVSNELPFEYAGFAEPLSTVIHGMKKLRVKTGEKLLVIGAGTMGNLNAQVARYFGADVTLSDISEKKLKTAYGLGFENTVNARDADYIEKANVFTEGAGFDTIIIAVGVTEAYNQAIEMVAIDGKLLIFAAGYPKPEWNIDPNTVHYKLWEIIGTFGCGAADYQEAVRLLSDKTIDVSPLIEERVSLAEIQRAFEKASTPDNYRVAVMI
jgi:L-iditol 2-dehydrogenase